MTKEIHNVDFYDLGKGEVESEELYEWDSAWGLIVFENNVKNFVRIKECKIKDEVFYIGYDHISYKKNKFQFTEEKSGEAISFNEIKKTYKSKELNCYIYAGELVVLSNDKISYNDIQDMKKREIPNILKLMKNERE